MKMYKVVSYVIDFENIGPDAIEHGFNHMKYFYPHVEEINSVDIGEWSDDHPLNKLGADWDSYFKQDE